LNDANSQSEEILENANKKADEIIAQAQAEADKIKSQSDEKIALEKNNGEIRAKSSADLKKRQAILKAKQEIINNVIDKAYGKILAMKADEYFAMLEKIIEKSAQAKAGEIRFSAKDAGRLPQGFDKRVADIASKCGGSLKVSDTTVDIDGGFVLIYGGIEENCSIKAMFNADREGLADKVNNILFE
jgi:V/A-type H+-transporting ATPase subunit E